MQPLIDAGYVYIAQPPLYRLTYDGKKHYVFSDAERDEVLAQLPANKKVPIQRFKGLGEMNAEDLWETTMDPATRTFRQVTLEDAALADEIFSILMGEDVESRREFIMSNAKEAELDV
jgi:DNA gyrase subunit B